MTSKRFPDAGSAQNRAPACAYEVLVPLGARVPLERAVLHGESANARFEAPNGAAETSQFMTLVGSARLPERQTRSRGRYAMNPGFPNT